MRIPIAERLEAHSIPEPNSGCWLWIGVQNGTGYGGIKMEKKQKYAHRVSWESVNGPIPDELEIRHSCDVRCCINPRHMSLGTALDNKRDAVSRDRHVYGERVTQARLTANQVRAIRERYAEGGESQEAIGKDYGVSQAHVGKIVNWVWWKHLPMSDA